VRVDAPGVRVVFVVVAFALTLVVVIVIVMLGAVVSLRSRVIVAFVVFVGVAVVGSHVEQFYSRARVDGENVRAVRLEVGKYPVDPRLEAGHAVDEQARITDRLSNAWPRLPAVSVLADGSEKRRGRRVAGDRHREVSEDEERRLRRTPLGSGGLCSTTAGTAGE
jgi:hypothetical protein